MQDAPSTHNTGDNVPVFSVTEVSGLVKTTVEGAFAHVRIRGEISGFKRAASGHLYFALKDESAVLDGVCWRSTAGRLPIDPEDGMEVIATGRITTYAGRSKYQLVVESLELAGEGALLKLLEERKRKLAAEGLFDEKRKQDIPFLPDVIGVVTSPTGSVIRDILHRLADRFPRHVLVWPALVQGDGAAEQIARGIRGFNELGSGDVPRPDLVIVARGGGSLEDLWAFNEEIVVRAAADSAIPLISAVGHETDWTLIDLAADLRAPTPTAAAEIAVPVRVEVMAQVADLQARSFRGLRRTLDGAKRDVAAAARGLPNLRRTVEEASQRLDDWSDRLGNALRVGLRQRGARVPQRIPRPDRLVAEGQRRLAGEAQDLKRAMLEVVRRKRQVLDIQTKLLESFSYERVLDRGFALVTDADGAAVTSISDVGVGDDVTIQLSDGKTAARIAGGAPIVPKKKQSKKKPSGDDGQGSLL